MSSLNESTSPHTNSAELAVSTSQPPVLRVGRPTRSIADLLPFYTTGLGFTVLSSFTSHTSFDGVILGHPGWPYHLEFTTYLPHLRQGSVPGGESENAQTHSTRAPSQDNLLVFYVPDRAEWEARVKRMEDAGFEPVTSFNPWWDGQGGCDGRTYEDCEGWRAVLWNGGWGK